MKEKFIYNVRNIIKTGLCIILLLYSVNVKSQTLGYGPVRLDAQNKLLPRITPEATAYDVTLDRQWNFLLNQPADYNGKQMYYFYCGFRDNNPNSPDGWTNDVGEKLPVFVRSALSYYAYTGNVAPLNNVIGFANYAKNYITSSAANWPNMPITTADGGEINYNGEEFPAGGNGTWPVNEVHIDQAADMAYAYFRLYLYNGNTSYRDVAINVANTLVSKMVTGNATTPPWPYVVNSANGAIVSDYTSNFFQAMELFDELIAANLGDVSNYQTARTKLKTWLLQYPMVNGKWVDGHGDNYLIGSTNLSNTTKSNACLYLLDNPSFDPNFATDVPKLLQWTEDNMSCTCPDNYITYGAHVPAEQVVYKLQMGYQTARLAAEYARWYTTSQNAVHKDIAYRSANYWTYMVADDGMARDGNSDQVGWWWSDCYGEAPSMFYYIFSAFPEWAPPAENHILYATGALKNVTYSTSQVQYTTTDNNGTEYLRVAFLPGTVTLGGAVLTQRTDLNAEGYTLRNLGSGDYAITIKRTHTGNVNVALGTPVPVTGVSVSPTSASVSVAGVQQLTATVVPVNATNKTVSWSSSNTSIATVSTSGLVTGVAAGTATITVTTQDGSKTATSAITVSNVAVTGVSVSPTSASVSVAGVQQLTATVAPANATNKTVSWSSGNTSIATVSSSGLVTGVAVGTATITATTQDGSKTAAATITVTSSTGGDGLKGEYYNAKDLSGSIAVTQTDATINFNWGTGTYATGQPVNNFSVRWTGQILPKYTETYTFETETDDGVRLWVNDVQLINKWIDQGPTKFTGTISLIAGTKYNIKMEYYENGGGAVAKLRWSSASQAYEVIPQSQLFSTVVVALVGISVLTTQVPASSDSDQPYELGMKFRSTQAGTITKIRYYKISGETGTHTGRIWTSTGTQLASVVFSGETANGWQVATLSTPLSIAANTTYVVSVNSSANYAVTQNGLQTSIVNGPLSSVADGANGVYNTTPGLFPNSSYNNTNYFRDVVFISTSGGRLETEQDVSNDIVIYPNPTTGEFQIEFVNKGLADVIITNPSGQSIVNFKRFGNINEKINLSNHGNGLYLLRIQNNKGVSTKKIVMSK